LNIKNRLRQGEYLCRGLFFYSLEILCSCLKLFEAENSLIDRKKKEHCSDGKERRKE